MDIESVCKSPNVREAMEQDYSFLRLSCAWGRIANYPLPLLLQRKSVAGESFIGNVGFRGQKCGSRSPSVGVASQSQAPGYFKPYTKKEG